MTTPSAYDRTRKAVGKTVRHLQEEKGMKSPVKSGKGPEKVHEKPMKSHGAMPKGKVDKKAKGRGR